jgi:hypothetical protein
VRIVNSTLEQFNLWASERLGLPISIHEPYKLCDLKPAYGVIFADYLSGYDFWGNADIDVIYGNIRSFLTEELLSKYDVISSRKEYLAGHLTLYRNCPEINRLYERSADYPKVFLDEEHFSFCECSRMWRHLHDGGSIFDEYVHISKLRLKKRKPPVESMTHIVKRMEQEGNLRAHFETIIKDRPELQDRNWKLVWENGFLSNALTGEKTLYFHMIGLKGRSDFKIPNWEEIPERFFITRCGFSRDGYIQESITDRIVDKLPMGSRIRRWKNMPY